MVITSEGKARVLAKNSEMGKDGKTTYYNLAVLINGEAGNINCTLDAYESAVEDAVNVLTYTYNSQYQYFRIQSACVASPEAAPAAKAAAQDKPTGKQ